MTRQQQLLAITTVVLLLALISQNYESLGLLLPLLFKKGEETDNAMNVNSFFQQPPVVKNTLTALKYPCRSAKNEWRSPGKAVLKQSLTELKKCKNPAENYWGDTVEIIVYRTVKAAAGESAHWQSLSKTPFSQLPSSIKKNWNDKIIDELINSSVTASGKGGREQDAAAAKASYKQGFAQIQAWLDEGAEITLERITDLNALLLQKSEQGKLWRDKNGGNKIAHFAEHQLLTDIIHNLACWLNNPGPKYHPLEVALISQQLFIAAHPFIDANGRTSMLLLNWILQRYDYPPIAYTYEGLKQLVVFSALSQEGQRNSDGLLSGAYRDLGVHALTVSPGIMFQSNGHYRRTWLNEADRDMYYKEQKKFSLLAFERIVHKIEQADSFIAKERRQFKHP